ncbi:MAG: outer membrane lipid asymmetry maintenance protein MlaD [Pseudomonadota bacterium]|nr:outer membrane lipid asymmetry maintenance protein MlaD [Pseudomonadota bacterium]
MTQTRLLELIVGLFVCLGLAALFLLTLQVSTVNGFNTEPNYRVTARFQDVGSLRPRAPVSMAGVRIGRVTDIQIDTTTFEAEVTMEIYERYNNLPEDSDASILTSGLLGEQYIGITPGGSLTSLADGDEIRFTQSALVLENLIGQFVTRLDSD